MVTVLTREYWERIIENVKPYKNHTNKGEDYAISNSCNYDSTRILRVLFYKDVQPEEKGNTDRPYREGKR